MADADYQRLSAACFCGEPVKLWSGRGRRPRYCGSHKEPPRTPPAKEHKQCPACRGIFVSARDWQVYCTKTCRLRATKGIKPRDEVRSYACVRCSKSFESTYWAPMYCSKTCKKAASIERSPERKKAYAARAAARKAPTLCAYFAKACERCSRCEGRRQDWRLCSACVRSDQMAAAREAYTAMAEAKHKAAGRAVECDECGAAYCPLYGFKPGPTPLCSPCSRTRKKRHKATHRAKRNAVERGADAEDVNPYKVFARDGWACKLCGIATPEHLRGTIEHNAPELDHVRPISKGGQHTYANTQCLCRSCNGFKSDRTMDELAEALAA